ncbi:MAG: GGDEF domain-containing protein, partial [Armatimonadota bacterium]|nr:GGDEF domain-containing protein [Armatimonadota bacterium]
MPPLSKTAEPSGLVLLCDLKGSIVKVIYDGLGLRLRLVPGKPFVEAIGGSREGMGTGAAPAQQFMDMLLKTGYAFGWELPVPTHECVETLRFTGGAADQGMLIVGEPVHSHSTGLIEELMKINNETVNTLRTAVKQASIAPAAQRTSSEQEMALLTELSRANNGAMTAQRELAKKNAALLQANAALERAGTVLAGKQAALEDANLRLDALATLDGLTGVKNRRAFEDILAREVARSLRYGTPLSLILLDVDKFKEYNDSYGHQAGDDVLKAVGRLLQEQARATDFVARYGG